MKTIPTPALPLLSDQSLKIVEANPEKTKAVIASLKKEKPAVAKVPTVIDKPENWDETWFANYE